MDKADLIIQQLADRVGELTVQLAAARAELLIMQVEEEDDGSTE